MNFGLLSAGIAIGIVAGHAILRSSRKESKLCEAYMHERIESKFKDALKTMTPKPELIVEGSSKLDRLSYRCSWCRLEFPLSDDLTPKEAVIELYRCFREHIEMEHPPASRGPVRSATPAGD